MVPTEIPGPTTESISDVVNTLSPMVAVSGSFPALIARTGFPSVIRSPTWIPDWTVPQVIVAAWSCAIPTREIVIAAVLSIVVIFCFPEYTCRFAGCDSGVEHAVWSM